MTVLTKRAVSVSPHQMTVPGRDIEQELHDLCASWYADPLSFVRGAYPWPIQGEAGPVAWQCEELDWLGHAVADRGYDGSQSVAPIRKALSTGNGVGKTALFAWVVDWLMSTRSHCRVTVTANTADQLEKKTWAAVRDWTARCATGHWFEINNNIMYRKGFRASWFAAPLSCAPENTDAYQGQHARGSTSAYIFDEASGIPESIWDAAEGGLTDEPVILVGGNPLRSTGRFHQVCFGTGRDRWSARIIDARTVTIAPHATIAEWIEEKGDDDDFVRVHVKGLPPQASSLQFIDHDRVYAAQRRQVDALADDPLICGVDVSGGGGAWTVARFRRGVDGKSWPPLRFSGEQTRDRNAIIAALAERLRQTDPHERIAAMFIDSAFGSPIVERLHVLGFEQVHEVSFGGPSPDVHQKNQRAYQWNLMKDWLKRGMIPIDARLEADLVGPGFHLTPKDELVLESKESMQKRGVASPDDGDALSLTFAQPVRLRPRATWARTAAHGTGEMAWAE